MENVEEFKAHLHTETVMARKHFTLRGRNQSKVLTLDAVPLEWLSRPDDSDEEMEDAEGSENEEEEDVVMQDADGEGKDEDEEEEQPVSQELIDATAKHLKICVSATNKKYNTSVVRSDFQWTDPFPTSIPLDEFAMEDASFVEQKMPLKSLFKKQCQYSKSVLMLTERRTICCAAGKKTQRRQNTKQNKKALSTKEKALTEEFYKVKKLFNNKKMEATMSNVMHL